MTRKKASSTISIHRLQVAMKADQYSRYDSVRVKARASYQCQICGSDQMVQAHAPNGDHSDWRKGVCLCAEHHSEQHPNVPRSLFFTKVHQPYWPNISARALAAELGCHNRTVIRTAKRLGITSGAPISDEDKERVKELVNQNSHNLEPHVPTEIQLPPKIECQRCHHRWIPRQAPVIRCAKCKSPYWDRPRAKFSKIM